MRYVENMHAPVVTTARRQTRELPAEVRQPPAFTSTLKVPPLKSAPPPIVSAHLRTAIFLNGLPRFPSLEHLEHGQRSEALNGYLREFNEYTRRAGQHRQLPVET